MPDIIIKGSRDDYFPVGARWQTSTRYLLVFRAAGDLQLFSPAVAKIWSSETAYQNAQRLRMQLDGNMVIYDVLDRPVWATHTGGNPGSFFMLQEDGNMVIYSKERAPLWTSGTVGK